MCFNDSKINDIFDIVSTVNATNITQVSMDNIAKNLKEIFMEPAKVTRMYTQYNTSTNNRRRRVNKPWFNNDCEASKKDYKEFKKSLSKNQNDTEKADLKLMANKHKKTDSQREKKI